MFAKTFVLAAAYIAVAAGDKHSVAATGTCVMAVSIYVAKHVHVMKEKKEHDYTHCFFRW